MLRFGRHTFVASSKILAHVPETGEGRDVVSTLTLGGTRAVARPRGWDVAAGADVTFYAVPGVLRPYYGNSPLSFHVFIRIRPPAPMRSMLRMMDMTMGGMR